MTVGVYAFFDQEGSCLYVGQSSNIEERYKQHMKQLRGGYHKRTEFNEWFESSEERMLVFKVLKECSNETDTKNYLEIEYFNQLNPRFYGQIPSMNNKFSHSEETRKRISTSVRKNLEELGLYETRACPCGSDFIALVKKTTKYCSSKCVIDDRKSSLDHTTVSELYNSGLTLTQVGKVLGVSYRTVHYFMVKNDIPRRASGPVAVLPL